MPSIIQSFIPWILFFVLYDHSAASQEAASVVALIAHVLINYKPIRKGFVLDIGGLIFFIFYIINLYILDISFVTNNGYLISTLAIAVIAWVSLIIKKPFTLQYARQTVPRDIASSSLFFYINFILTGVWAILLTLMSLPKVIDIYRPFPFETDINLAFSILLIVVGAWISKVFPDWLANKLITKRFKIDIKQAYARHATMKTTSHSLNTEMAEKCHNTADVVIVGAGPIGLSCALALQQHGIHAVVLERHAGTSIHPKARGISCRSVELFRRLGVAEKIEKYNLPAAQNWFGWFSSLTGALYARILPTTEYHYLSPAAPASAAQQYLERELANQFKQLGGNIIFRQQVEKIAQNNEKIQVTSKDRDNNQTTVWQANYLIGADGAHSTVRRQLGIAMIGPDEISINCSIYCEIDLDDVIDLEKRFSIAFVLKADGPAPMVIAIDGKKRWIFLFPSAGASAAVLRDIYTDDYAKEQICAVIGKEVSITIISKQIWSLGAQIANEFAVGRIFMAGDSLHRFPPSGGMGMNTGLQDVDNLMWKIAYVIKKQAAPTILQTYQQERLPAILENMQWSLNNLYRIVKIQRETESKNINEIDFQLLVQEQEAHLNKSGIDLGVIYESPLIAKTDEHKPKIEADHYIPNTYTGARLPHFEIVIHGKPGSSLDLVSTSFIFICQKSAGIAAEKIDFKSIPTELIMLGDNTPIVEQTRGEFQQLLELDDFGAVWVRPDGHIAWKGRLNDADDLAKLSQVVGYIAYSEISS